MRKLIVLFCACALGAAADAPYAGKWKMNVAKSDFGHTTMTYEQMSGGEMKATMDGQSYTFKLDGADNMTPWGMTIAWKVVDQHTWATTEKSNGQVISNGTWKLSSDGKKLSLESKRMKAGGGMSDDSMTFQRVSGGPGLAGKWQTKNLKSSSPETMSLTPQGMDGLSIAMGNAGGICEAKFDGKDHPAMGPMWPEGWACAIEKNGERGLDLTWKKDGKPMYKTTMTVSGDGRTLTEVGSAVGVPETVKVVYDKQ